MSRPVFLVDQLDAQPGDVATLDGREGHHAVRVRRLTVGEQIILTDGCDRAVAGTVTRVGGDELDVTVSDVILPRDRAVRYTVVQALPKGERAELAVSMLTEIGVREIWAWAAARSVVKWHGSRGEKSLAKWQACAREAMKQSRRYRIPSVRAVSTADVVAGIQEADLAVVLHEEATQHIADVRVPSGNIVVIVGPEGGIAPDELQAFTEAGALPVTISDGVLRTSTAGVVALGQLEVLAR